MEKSTSKTKGQLLQEELFRWFHAVLDASPCGDAPQAFRLNALRHHLEVLIRDGWTLKMSGEDSPADKCGIDFIWGHPVKGWFPLDAKAVGTSSCVLIHQVTVGNQNGAGECGQLKFEYKVAFLSKLVELARSANPISHEKCAPPQLMTARSAVELIEGVKQFQRRLMTASETLRDDRYNQWAISLRRAIGFLLAAQRGGADDDSVTRARNAINTALDAFLAQYLSQNAAFASSCMRLQTVLRRSDRLKYEIGIDTVKAPVGPAQRLVVLGGLAQLVRKKYEAKYEELLHKHRSAEWLMQRKRTFETKGVELAIHYILNSLEALGGKPARRAA